MGEEVIAGPLTILIWLIAFATGGIAFARTKKQPGDRWRIVQRVIFSLSVMLAIWSVVTYALWLAGVPLKIGTIQDGHMAENWWLPGFTVIWAALSYRSLKY